MERKEKPKISTY